MDILKEKSLLRVIENAVLAQVSLCEMHQEHDETIYSFSAHVCAQILAWNYLKSCHNS